MSTLARLDIASRSSYLRSVSLGSTTINFGMASNGLAVPISWRIYPERVFKSSSNFERHYSNSVIRDSRSSDFSLTDYYISRQALVITVLIANHNSSSNSASILTSVASKCSSSVIFLFKYVYTVSTSSLRSRNLVDSGTTSTNSSAVIGIM
jgi:hypothetical protein